MTYGVPPKSTHTLPAGRRPFHESTKTVLGGRPTEIIKSGTKYPDGQDRAGVSGEQHATAKASLYADGEPYRAAHRGGEPVHNNEPVHSKNTKRYGRDGSKGDFPHSSTGEQPATLEKRPLPPSVPPYTHHTDRVPPGGVSQRVGFPGGGQPFVAASHTTTGKHGSDGIHDPRKSTDGAQGQAWAASGGEHGKPSPRRK